MTRKLIEHLASIVVVGALFVAAMLLFRSEAPKQPEAGAIAPYLGLDFLDFGDPADVALFRETLGVYSPRTPARNDSVVAAILAYRQEVFTNPLYKTGGGERGLTRATLVKLGGMFLSFAVVYIMVLALSYYGARTLALYRFVKTKQHAGSYLETFLRELRATHPVLAVAALAKAIIKGCVFAVLFSPAYVIAYSIRSRFDTESLLFMAILGLISNGLLINYANRFYTFLVAESRKGYVETAIVKNLKDSYAWHGRDGVPFRAVLRPGSLLPSHVLHHIYLNARSQSLPTLKEHASFLVTGLVIIEMALNIQGHLCYELMQNILYREYDVALAIVLGIFLLMKATEITVDLYCHREARRYENRA